MVRRMFVENNLLMPRIKDDCVLSKGVSFEDLKESSEEKTVEVSPCTSERGKVMAEIDLSSEEDEPFLDIDLLCQILESYKSHFAEIKCSQKLGVGRLMWKSYRLYLYEDGKFKVRFAHDKKDAIQTLNSVLRLILSSIICEECNQSTAECVLGVCQTCTNETPEKINLENHFNLPILKRGFDSLGKALENTEKLEKKLFSENGDWPRIIGKSMGRKFREGIEYGMNFSLEAQEIKDLKIGVLLVSLSRENLLTLKNEEELVKQINKKSAKKKIKKCCKTLWQINKGVLESLDSEKQKNLEKTEKQITKSYENLKEIKKSGDDGKLSNTLKNLEKRLNNAQTFLEKIKN